MSIVLQHDNAKKDFSQKDLKRIIRDLDLGNVDIALLKELAILSSQHPVDDEATLHGDKVEDVWEGGALFRKLLVSLFHQLTSDKVSSVISFFYLIDHVLL